MLAQCLPKAITQSCIDVPSRPDKAWAVWSKHTGSHYNQQPPTQAGSMDQTVLFLSRLPETEGGLWRLLVNWPSLNRSLLFEYKVLSKRPGREFIAEGTTFVWWLRPILYSHLLELCFEDLGDDTTRVAMRMRSSGILVPLLRAAGYYRNIEQGIATYLEGLRVHIEKQAQGPGNTGHQGTNTGALAAVAEKSGQSDAMTPPSPQGCGVRPSSSSAGDEDSKELPLLDADKPAAAKPAISLFKRLKKSFPTNRK